MNDDSGGLWWLVAVLTGAVGTAMVVYGMRQKESLPLTFGIIIGGVPILFDSAWAAAIVSVLSGILFYVLRKWL
jgi:hypothetical protein